MDNNPAALVVDDSETARALVSRELSHAGFQTWEVADGLGALDLLAEREFDLMITDLRMPGIDGLGLVERVREFSDMPVIVLTAFPSLPDCERAVRGGATRFLSLREDFAELGSIARRLLASIPACEDIPDYTVREARRRRDEDLRRTLQRLIRRTGGNVSQIAEILGKDRTTALYHLKRFGLY